MPGFYKSFDDGTVWKTYAMLPGVGSLEMGEDDADVFVRDILPRLKSDLLAEGCGDDSFRFEFSSCRPVSGGVLGQVALSGFSRESVNR